MSDRTADDALSLSSVHYFQPFHLYSPSIGVIVMFCIERELLSITEKSNPIILLNKMYDVDDNARTIIR